MSQKPKTRKRKRKAIKTCSACRQRHEKCDGGSPCVPCWRMKTECVYLAPKKRGPRPGYRKKYKEKIEELEDIIKEKNELLARLTGNDVMEIQMLSPSNIGVQLVNAGTVFGYVNDLYNYTCQITDMVLPIEVGRVSLSVASPKSFHAYATATFSAYLSGNLKQREQLEKVAIRFGQEIEGVVHPNEAGGHLILGIMYFVQGDMLKAVAHTSKASKTATAFREKNKDPSINEKYLLDLIKWHDSLNKNASNEIRDEITDAVSTALLAKCHGETSELCRIEKKQLVFFLTSKVLLRVSTALANEETLTPSEHTTQMLYMMQADALISPDHGVYAPVMSLVTKAKFQMLCGNRNKAHEFASSGLNLLKKMNLQSMIGYILMNSLLPVFAIIGAPDEFIECFQYITESSKKWRIAKVVVNLWMTMIDCATGEATESDKNTLETVQKAWPTYAQWEAQKIVEMLRKVIDNGYSIQLPYTVKHQSDVQDEMTQGHSETSSPSLNRNNNDGTFFIQQQNSEEDSFADHDRRDSFDEHDQRDSDDTNPPLNQSVLNMPVSSRTEHSRVHDAEELLSLQDDDLLPSFFTSAGDSGIRTMNVQSLQVPSFNLEEPRSDWAAMAESQLNFNF